MNVKSSTFARNAFTLTFGTTIAQALPFLFYPVLTRIYSPEEFGLLATLIGITVIVTILASGTYEGAILISKSKEEAADIVSFTLARALFVLFFVSITLFLFRHDLSRILNEPRLANWIIVIPIISMTTLCFNLYNEWCVTFKYYKNLAINKVTNTSSIAIFKVLFGLPISSLNGLILGDLLGKTLTAVVCVKRAIRFDGIFLLKSSRSSWGIIRKKYKQFIHYYMPDQVINNISGYIHVFFISAFFNSYELGLVSISLTLLTVPVSVISAAIKDVFRQRANEEFKANGNCRRIYLKLLWPLTTFGLLISLCLYFILPDLFRVALGEEWMKAGIYSRFLLPLFFTNFVSMSLGGVFIVVGKLKVSMYWQIFSLTTAFLALFLGYHFYGTIENVIICFSLAKAFSYILYATLSFYYAKK